MRIESGWTDYCIYSGKHCSKDTLSLEHVFPKSLGGRASATIRVCRKLNNQFGTEIDGRLMKDAMIQFARMNSGTTGNSGKKPTAVLKNAQAWKGGRPNPDSKMYTLTHEKGQTMKVFDPISRSYMPSNMINEYGFVIKDMNIEHAARFKFTVKTLLGLGWKYFRADILDAIDTNVLRKLLTQNITITTKGNEGGISYVDPFLVKSGTPQLTAIEEIQKRLIRDKISTVLVREIEARLEWSVSVLGTYVGTIQIPLDKSLIKLSKEHTGILRLDIRKGSLGVQEITAF